jgi:hypothetical protein
MTGSFIEIKVVLAGGDLATCTFPVMVWDQHWDDVAIAMAASPAIKKVSVVKTGRAQRRVIKDEVPHDRLP